jgi:chemotaxis response regulator CheB
MPKAVVQAGAADAVVKLPRIPQAVTRLVRGLPE